MIIRPTWCPGCASKLRTRRLGPRNELHPHCPACGFVHYDNPVPCVGVLVMHDGRLLLGKRRQNPFRGWWNVLGGFVEGREHPEETAVREVLEEAGVEVRLEGLQGIYIDRYGKTPEITMNLVYRGTLISGEPQAGDDIAALRWFAPHEIDVSRIAFACGRTAVTALLADWPRD